MLRYLNFVMASGLMLMSNVSFALEGDMIKLPEPEMTGGLPLMQALKERHSTREFSPKPLPEQVLSNLLWAAAGVNRPASGKRTAPSAMNWQEIDIYVVLAEGVYRYDARQHALLLVSKEDLREATGMQDFVAEAPVNRCTLPTWTAWKGQDRNRRISMRLPIRDLLRRMSTCSVPLKGWPRWCVVPSTGRHWHPGWDWMRIRKSCLRRRWVILPGNHIRYCLAGSGRDGRGYL